MMSTSVSRVCFSSLNGPSFCRCRGSPRCRPPSPRRGSTRSRRCPFSTSGDEQMPWNGQSFARPAASLSCTACHRNVPSDSRNAIRTPLSPLMAGSRIASLLVPTSTMPLATTGIAVGLGAELGDPLDVLLRLDVPARRQALHGRDDVAVRRAAPHRPVALAGIGPRDERQRAERSEADEADGGDGVILSMMWSMCPHRLRIASREPRCATCSYRP